MCKDPEGNEHPNHDWGPDNPQCNRCGEEPREYHPDDVRARRGVWIQAHGRTWWGGHRFALCPVHVDADERAFYELCRAVSQRIISENFGVRGGSVTLRVIES